MRRIQKKKKEQVYHSIPLITILNNNKINILYRYNYKSKKN